MINGTLKNKIDHRDYSYIKTFHPDIYAGTSKPQFPPSYNTDAGFPIPNQNTAGLTDGCTDEATASLAQDLSVTQKDPLEVEKITQANIRGGAQVRDGMQAGVKLGWFSQFFNVAPEGGLDWYDAVKLAISSGMPEKRSISVGSRWLYNYFNNPMGGGILPTPQWDTNEYVLHNWKVCGWDQINGVEYLKIAPWLGPNYGTNGFAYMSREIFNQLMSFPYSIAFVGTRESPTGPIYTIDLSFLQYWISYIKTWVGFSY